MTWNAYANLMCRNTLRLSRNGVAIMQTVEFVAEPSTENKWMILGENMTSHQSLQGPKKSEDPNGEEYTWNNVGTYGLGAYVRQVLDPDHDGDDATQATKMMRLHSPVAKLVQLTIEATVSAIGQHIAARNRKTIGHAVSSANTGEHVDVVLGSAY